MVKVENGRKRPRASQQNGHSLASPPSSNTKEGFPQAAATLEAIRKQLLQHPVDTDLLRETAFQPGGFICHEMRHRVWPKLLGLDRFDLTDYRDFLVVDAPSPCSEQIQRDVDRSMWHLQNLNPCKKKKRGTRRRLLSDILNAMMIKHPELKYYQGYHDIISVLVLVLTEDPRLCFTVAERISLTFLADFMRESFEPLLPVIQLLFPLLEHFDPKVHSFLERAGVHAYFSLSWIITWYSHDVYDLNLVARLFDVFLSSPPSFPLYLAAAIVLHRKQELLATDCDFALVHNLISHLPHDLPYDLLVTQALAMFRALPPPKLVKLGDRSLPSLIATGQVVSFKHPPDWYQRHVSADWVVLEKKGGGRSRGIRSRRRKAAEAGAKVPGKKDHDRKGVRGKVNHTPRLLVLVGVGFTTMGLLMSWYLGRPMIVGASSSPRSSLPSSSGWLPRPPPVIALKRALTQR